MRRQKLILSLATLALAFVTATASAAMVMKMGLGDLVGNADKVFRGTVLTKEPGTVAVGGGELPTVIYTIRVDEALKGDFSNGKDAQAVTVTMLGSLKAPASNGNEHHLFSMDVNPNLEVGSEYVLFTTTPSAAGLTTTVGLGQGLFRIFANAQARELAANGLDNHGIFDGPVQYAELVAAIHAILSQ